MDKCRQIYEGLILRGAGRYGAAMKSFVMDKSAVFANTQQNKLNLISNCLIETVGIFLDGRRRIHWYLVPAYPLSWAGTN